MMSGRRLCVYCARWEGLPGCGVSINGAGYGVLRYNTMIEDKVDSAESSRVEVGTNEVAFLQPTVPHL